MMRPNESTAEYRERIKRMMISSGRRRQKFDEENHTSDGRTYIDLIVDTAVKDTKWLWPLPERLSNLICVPISGLIGSPTQKTLGPAQF